MSSNFPDRLVPNIISEIRFLIQLLTATQPARPPESLQGNRSLSVTNSWLNVHNTTCICMYRVLDLCVDLVLLGDLVE